VLLARAEGHRLALAPSTVRKDRIPEAVALALFAVLVLRPALRERPQPQGDSAEYFLTSESLLNHGTPLVMQEDLGSLGELARRHGREEELTFPSSLYLASPAGDVQGIHFWAYPLATLPARVLLRALGEHELKAPQITNAALLLSALVHVLCFSTLSVLAARVFAAGLCLSPLLHFVLWPHPEVFSTTLVASALVFRHDRRPIPAVLCAALASTQNTPLVLLAGWLLVSSFRAKGRGDRVLLVAAFLPALAPSALALLTLGTPHVLIRAGAADTANLSLRRALELLLDPDIGLFPYAPLTLLVALIALARRPSRPLVEDAILLLGMAFACTVVANWNSGTSGPSRYGVWLLPLAVDMLARSAAGASRAYRIAAVLAVAVQAAIAIGRGGLHAGDDHLRHGALAEVVLDRWPSLYDPDFEVFTERTRHEEGQAEGPVVFEAGGRCRKALLQKRHVAELVGRCGPWPEGPDFRALKAAKGRDARAYVSY
jgi:hypothetical protein